MLTSSLLWSSCSLLSLPQYIRHSLLPSVLALELEWTLTCSAVLRPRPAEQQIPCTYVTKSSRRKVPERAASPIKSKVSSPLRLRDAARPDGARPDGARSGRPTTS